MIKQNTFDKAIKEFDKLEKRSYFFALAANLIKKGFEVEAYVLLLATWNFARFRYAVKEFDIDAFKKTLNDLSKNFESLKREKINSINLFTHKESIITIFNALSKIKGIEFTGAPKLMHLTNPKLFVMWDDYIRGAKAKKYYEELDIVESNEWKYAKYHEDANGYINFLNDMQCHFSHLSLSSNKKTLAKAIDEFNYVKITLPIQKMKKENKKNKNKRR